MRPYTDLMLDIETLGKTPGCIVTQIGVCLFNREGDDESVETASWNLDLFAQESARLAMDVDTVLWWMQKSDEARMSWAGSKPRVLPSVALGELAALVQNGRALGFSAWANSPQFDFSILEPLWKLARVPKPWAFYQEADMRTLKLVASNVPKVTPALAHDAASDAQAQAEYVRNVFSELRRQRGTVASAA